MLYPPSMGKEYFPLDHFGFHFSISQRLFCDGETRGLISACLWNCFCGGVETIVFWPLLFCLYNGLNRTLPLVTTGKNEWGFFLLKQLVYTTAHVSPSPQAISVQKNRSSTLKYNGGTDPPTFLRGGKAAPPHFPTSLDSVGSKWSWTFPATIQGLGWLHPWRSLCNGLAFWQPICHTHTPPTLVSRDTKVTFVVTEVLHLSLPGHCSQADLD